MEQELIREHEKDTSVDCDLCLLRDHVVSLFPNVVDTVLSDEGQSLREQEPHPTTLQLCCASDFSLSVM